jgi:hypothetical protein
MTSINCKYCSQSFNSLLLDIGQAVSECAMNLSKHVMQTHTNELGKLQQNMNILQVLIFQYYPIVFTGYFNNSEIVASVTGINPMEDVITKMKDKILEILVTTINTNEPYKSDIIVDLTTTKM